MGGGIDLRNDVGGLAGVELGDRGVDDGIALQLRLGEEAHVAAVGGYRGSSEKFAASSPKSSPESMRFLMTWIFLRASSSLVALLFCRLPD